MDKVKEFFTNVKNWIIAALTAAVAWLSGILEQLGGIL